MAEIDISEPSPVYTDFRKRLFALTPQELGVSPSTELPTIWGVVMEIGLPAGAATLSALADGSVGFYFHNGGVILAGTEAAMVQSVAREFLLSAENIRQALHPADAFTLPGRERVRFYIFTYDGILSAEAGEGDISDGTHPLTQLFYEANSLLNELRMSREKKQ